MRPLTLTVAAMRQSVPPVLILRASTCPRTVADHVCDRPTVSGMTAMRVLNAAQMREADRRTIEDIGIPSLVLMENAGRQVVAAMEAMHSDLLERQVARALRPRQQRRRRLRRRADAAAARRRRRRCSCIGRVADVRGDARINLEILGRLGLTVVEVADSQAWELHFSEVSDCTLIVDAIFGTGLNAPVTGLIRDASSPTSTRRAFRSWRSICRRACRPIRTSRSATRSRPGMTVTLARAEAAAGAAAGRDARRRHRHRRHRHSRRRARRRSTVRASSC